MLIEDKISQGHAKMLVTLDEGEQKLIVDSIIGQKLNVRDTEILIKNIKNKGKKRLKKEHIDNINTQLLQALQDSFKILGIQAHINTSKITLSFENDAEVTALIKKISK